MSTAITSSDVRLAASELERMRGALRRWLKYRAINDAVLAGTAKVKKPLAYAQRAVATSRDSRVDLDLASKLHALLSTMFPDAQLPAADAPGAAVALATMAVTGQVTSSVTSPTATGGVLTSHPWLWPVLIVGGVLIMVTTAIKSAADVAAQKEHDACIEAGACTDYGFWLKAGGITMLAWFAWRELGLGELVKGQIKKRRGS